MRTTSMQGIRLITSFEGCRLTAYKAVPTEKYYTIGYGHYGPDVAAGMKISQSRATELLQSDLNKFEAKVNKYDGIYHWNQNEFDALVSFAYNVGSIDQLTSNGMRTKSVIADKIPAYNKSGGKILAGLTKRRLCEKSLFLKAAAIESIPVLKTGSSGEYVTALQTRLSTLGYLTRNQITCRYDQGTSDAVKAFQAEHIDIEGNPLTVDGITGNKTWWALLN